MAILSPLVDKEVILSSTKCSNPKPGFSYGINFFLKETTEWRDLQDFFCLLKNHEMRWVEIAVNENEVDIFWQSWATQFELIHTCQNDESYSSHCKKICLMKMNATTLMNLDSHHVLNIAKVRLKTVSQGIMSKKGNWTFEKWTWFLWEEKKVQTENEVLSLICWPSYFSRKESFLW